MASADKSKNVEAGVRLPGNESQHIDEKAGLQNSLVESQGSALSANTARLKLPVFITSARMPSFRHFLISFTIFAIFAATYTTAAVVHVRKHHAPTDDEVQFKKLLATISDPTLHDALEQYISSKYHPDAHTEDRTVIHYDNAAAFANLVELAKRQSSNGTTTTTTTSTTNPPTTSTVGPTTSDHPTTTPPTTSGTSDTSQPASSSTQTPPPSTSKPTSSSTSPPPPTSSSERSTSTSVSSTERNTRHSSKTKTAVYTTVRPDGSVSTVTTYTIVPASLPTDDAGQSQTPTLQDAAARFGGTGFVGYAFIFFIGLVAVL